MRSALRVEALKLARSRVGIIATAVIIGGMLALVGGLLAAFAAGNPEVTAKLGPHMTLHWSGMLDTAAQITGAGGLLGFGVVLAWLFAREFADGTITALFALPVGRGHIAIAKLAVYAIWSAAVSLTLVATLVALGLALGLEAPDAAVWAGLLRQLALGVLTAALATPVAWVVTAARSLLGGVATAVALVVIAQVGVLTGVAGWMPLAAPALWAMTQGVDVSAVQLGMPVLLAIAAGAATALSWHRLQLDR